MEYKFFIFKFDQSFYFLTDFQYLTVNSQHYLRHCRPQAFSSEFSNKNVFKYA